jgi:hypothetical protein
VSKGLGKVQTQILDLLKTKDRPLGAQDIASNLYEPQRVREYDPTPHAFYVSVRRAIHGLEARGLVVCGGAALDSSKYFVDLPRRMLMCWLPEQAAPKLKPILTGKLVEQTIIDVLLSAELVTDETDIYIMRGQGSWGKPGPFNNATEMMEYKWLRSKVRQRLAKLGWSFYGSTAPGAITRAVKRLKDKDIVKVRWKKAGVNGWIRLNKMAISVAS